MKWTNLSIVFSIFLLLIIVVQDTRVNALTAVNSKQRMYTNYLENAVDDGTLNLVELDSTRKNLILKKENAVNQFFMSLYANFGVLGDSRAEENLSGYVPIILICDEDGFYIYYTDIYQNSDEKIYVKRWSEKYPYVYKMDNLVYHFTLGSDGDLKVYDMATGETKEGSTEELKLIYSDSILKDHDTFNEYRRNAIITAIQDKMNYYINQYNNIAYQKGITYNFWLPQIDKADWYRTIDDISMLVIFQGYPYKAGGTDTYNRYAFGGTRIRKTRTYYITEENGMKYYHKEGCSHVLGSTGVTYYTKEDCANEGAFPDPDCSP
jgi:hypothetical protein